MSYLGKIKIDGGGQLPIASTLYGICESSAGAYAKEVTLNNFDAIIHGATVHIKFTNGNTAQLTNPSDSTVHLTLKVGTTAATQIANPGGSVAWAAGQVISFTFEENVGGTNYWRVNDGTVASFDTSGLATSDHIHGNITNDGKLSTASQAVVTDSNRNITTVSLEVTDNTVIGNTATSFVAKVTQNAQGKVTVTKSALPTASTSVAGIIQIGTTANDALAGNSAITIAGQNISLAGGSLSAATLREALSLTQALRFVGSTTTTMSDGYTGTPAGLGSGYTPAVGDVVLDGSSDAEYVCISVSGTTYTWERLGRDSSFALADAVLAKSLITNKGDMIFGNGTTTIEPTTLAIGSNGQILKVVSGIPAWSTLSGSDVGLGNVDNVKQIPASLGVAAGDIIYYNGTSFTTLTAGSTGKVLTISSGGVPAWESNQATDENVKQTIDSSSTSTFPVLFSTSQTSVADANVTSTVKRNNSVYIKPSTGTLTAAYFVGDGAGLTNLTWTNITNRPGVAGSSLGLVKTTSTVSTFTGYTAAPIDTNGVVYYKDTDTHYTSHLYITTSTGASNTTSALANGSVYIRLFDDDSSRDTHKISGNVGITVTTDTSSNLVFNTNLEDITFASNAPAAASSQTDIGFVHQGVLYLKRFASAT